jgi:hypothetical protein
MVNRSRDGSSRSLNDPAALVRAHAARLRRLRDDHIALTAPEPDIATCFEWTKTTIDSLRDTSRPNVDIVLAFLALGEFDSARDLIALLENRHAESGNAESPARLRACLAAWTGEFEHAAHPTKTAPETLARVLQGRLVDFTAGRSEAASRLWHADLVRTLQQPTSIPPDTAAALIIGLVHGLLGAEPDAPRNRLRLRPQIPASWNHMTLANLAMADARIGIRYHREEPRHTFHLQQTNGAVPVRLIFEPALPATTLRAASVNGVPAQLDARPFGERLLVPIQLVLDSERTLALEVETH